MTKKKQPKEKVISIFNIGEGYKIQANSEKERELKDLK